MELGCDNLFDKLYHHPMGGRSLLETDAAGTPGAKTITDLRLVAAPGRTCHAGIVAKF